MNIRGTRGLNSGINHRDTPIFYGRNKPPTQELLNNSTPVTTNNSNTTSPSPKGIMNINGNPREQDNRKAGHKSNMNSPLFRESLNQAKIMRPSSAYRHTSLTNKFIRENTSNFNSPPLNRVINVHMI